MNIYVSQLDFNTTSEDLERLFAEYGEVTSARVITDRFTGRSRGFGFVEMSDDNAGQNAINELDNSEFDNRTINVSVARPRAPRQDRGYNNFGGGYGGGNRY